MPQVYYCIPTYRSFQECRSGIEAAMNGTVAPDQIVVIDNSGNGSAVLALQDLTNKYPRVQFWPQTYNLGVAEAWNTFHRTLQDDYIIIANDDVAVHAHTIELLVNAAKDNPDNILFCGDGSSGNAYSLFLLTQQGFNKVGPFDKRFYPAYFEDRDHHYRMLLLGYDITWVSGATYDHVGSSTIKKYSPQEMDLHHNSFRANEAYYRTKWGGIPHKETYKEAFDGIL